MLLVVRYRTIMFPKKILNKISKMMQNTGGQNLSGYKDLDDIVSGGFRPGRLVIIAARPGIRKISAYLI